MGSKIIETTTEYTAPKIEVVELNSEGLICASGEPLTPGSGTWG